MIHALYLYGAVLRHFWNRYSRFYM